MKILLYGMQSSGASAICLLLAQRPECLAFIDVWSMYAAPRIPAAYDAVVKVVATTAFPLALHRERFEPDVTFLVLRHPFDLVSSLEHKSYANDDGLIEEKLSAFDNTFREAGAYDAILYHEDFVFSPRRIVDAVSARGWALDHEALRLKRTHTEMKRANESACPALKGRLKYGSGNLSMPFDQAAALRRPVVEHELTRRLNPAILKHYEDISCERSGEWDRIAPAAQSFGLQGVFEAAAIENRIAEKATVAGFEISINARNSCRFRDAEILLAPKQNGSDTVLTLRGPRARRFNRVSGYVRANNQCQGTTATVRVVDGAGAVIAKTERRLMQGDLRAIDLRFDPSNAAQAIELAVGSAPDTRSPERGLFFGDLSLDMI